MIAFLYLLTGFILAGLGGEVFVRGSVSLARIARIPMGIIGVTVAAFATSSPELSVAINAASLGKPDIALGDALGSNVINVGLILGIALCFGSLPSTCREVCRDWLVALAAPLVIGVLAYDGMLSRLDGVMLMAIFLVWLGSVILQAQRHRRNETSPLIKEPLRKSIAFCIAGVGLLVLAGLAIVAGAKEVGRIFEIPAFIVGATLVAFGTSMPELATTLIARLKGHSDMGLGTVLGSNVFNVFVIVAVAALIAPIPVDLRTLRLVLGMCVITTLVTWPTKKGCIPRWRGLVLIALYICHVAMTLMMGE
jgi:cation:H+ antiporter